MAGLTINSKLKMNSGYEIPILGYGVSHSVLHTQNYAENQQVYQT